MKKLNCGVLIIVIIATFRIDLMAQSPAESPKDLGNYIFETLKSKNIEKLMSYQMTSKDVDLGAFSKISTFDVQEQIEYNKEEIYEFYKKIEEKSIDIAKASYVDTWHKEMKYDEGSYYIKSMRIFFSFGDNKRYEISSGDCVYTERGWLFYELAIGSITVFDINVPKDKQNLIYYNIN